MAATDFKKDAHRALDIVRVEVSHTRQVVKVVVRVRDFARMDSGAPVVSAIGVHFNTRGNSTPDHLIKVDGMHTAAGSTRGWNELRPNGMDPWGDWIDCYPEGWNKPLIRACPARNEVVFRAPRSCLQTPKSFRVAVQSYPPHKTEVTGDWAIGTRRYLPRVTLN